MLAFAQTAEEDVEFTLSKGDTISQVLWKNLAPSYKLYAPGKVLSEILEKNALTLEQSKKLPIGTSFKVPRRLLKDQPEAVAEQPIPEPVPVPVPGPAP